MRLVGKLLMHCGISLATQATRGTVSSFLGKHASMPLFSMVDNGVRAVAWFNAEPSSAFGPERTELPEPV